jgi:hypothetical protein
MFLFVLNLAMAYFSGATGGAIMGSAFPGCGIVNNTYTCGDPNISMGSTSLPYDPELVNMTQQYAYTNKNMSALETIYIDVQGIATGVLILINIIGKSTIFLPWFFSSMPFQMPMDLAWYLSAGIWFVYSVGLAQLLTGRGLKYYK